jgi:poly(A) polymerase
VNGDRLPDAEWLHSAGLHALMSALDGQARIVGGAVRDSLLGLAVADIDLATPLRPDDVTKRLEHAGIKAIPTGIEHGTITAVSQNQTFEITTLRRDVSTDGRRATVAFSDDWVEDAARRDFTINALYADPKSGVIFDYFDGLADLENRTVRFIGDAHQRIAEDHLRILRFFRFHARFGMGAPDEAGIAACAAAAKSLMALSRERIADELMKLLGLADPSASVALMFQHGIFAAFLPEAKQERLGRLLSRENAVSAEPFAVRRLNAILPDNQQIVELVAARLKLSNKIRTALVARLIAAAPPADKARAIAYQLGREAAQDIYLLHGNDADWQAGYKQLTGWQAPLFPIKGGYLVSRGLTAGPIVAKTLRAAEKIWVTENFPSEERAKQITDQLIAEALSDKN